jgi:hypothetical protein
MASRSAIISSDRLVAPLPFRALLRYDPVPWLLSAGNPAITAFVRRDLFGLSFDATTLWELPEPARLLTC